MLPGLLTALALIVLAVVALVLLYAHGIAQSLGEPFVETLKDICQQLWRGDFFS